MHLLSASNFVKFGIDNISVGISVILLSLKYSSQIVGDLAKLVGIAVKRFFEKSTDSNDFISPNSTENESKITTTATKSITMIWRKSRCNLMQTIYPCASQSMHCCWHSDNAISSDGTIVWVIRLYDFSIHSNAPNSPTHIFPLVSAIVNCRTAEWISSVYNWIAKRAEFVWNSLSGRSLQRYRRARALLPENHGDHESSNVIWSHPSFVCRIKMYGKHYEQTTTIEKSKEM